MNCPYRRRLISLSCIVLIITGLVAGLPTRKTWAAGTTITITNVVILSHTCQPAARIDADFRITIDVAAPGTSAVLRYRISAPGLAPFDSASSLAPGGVIGPGPTTLSANWGVRGPSLGGAVGPSTLITILYYDTNSSAQAGINVNCTTGAFTTFSTGGSGGTTSSAGSSSSFFNPEDRRVEPNPGDRVVVWCNKDTLVVYGTDNAGAGFYLTTFTPGDLVGLSPQGKVRNLGDKGSISIGSYGQDRIWVAWFGGAFGANAKGGFIKTFTCLLQKSGGSSAANVNPAPRVTRPTNGITLAGRVNTYRLRLHSAPSLNASKLGLLEFGQAVTITGRDRSGFWLYISDGSQSGWVRGIYLVIVGNRFRLPIVG